MKRHRWKRGKRLTALFLATLMVVTSITLVPKQEVQAGIATEWILEATKDYVEKTIVDTMYWLLSQCCIEIQKLK